MDDLIDLVQKNLAFMSTVFCISFGAGFGFSLGIKAAGKQRFSLLLRAAPKDDGGRHA